ncbi:ribosome production factor 1 isoform X2 [Eurytemora carolleeae]|uniref:ribosome production factor 1 isoform X1 n=1 Tax=Eurytemora carolleeae TaxID=1294199 RepID=UPI000C76BB84|nr:ribosome production factor 1 isoform X1 [Eurytemora carolleeae]XP_023342593.1 ribosome production factor 1 isoform X2 [Eurytemora carolleeae]|eukprot:XP_023342592.1 ribosome production factor 1-like isoform X1 [Eurytemora affinis]
MAGDEDKVGGGEAIIDRKLTKRNQTDLKLDGENKIEKNISRIENKIRRNAAWLNLKREKKKEKRKRQDERKKEREELGEDAPPKLVPKTIDSMREYDETTVGGKTGEEEDEEIEHDIINDEFSEYFAKSYEPKVLVTSCDNPHSRTISFIKELTRIIPNSEPRWRTNASIKKMVKDGIKKGYTDIVIINEDNRSPNGLVVTHLPEGPTAYFKLSNVKITKDLHKNYRAITAHRPEVILNNFTTRLGHGVARMLASLFHYDPQFTGKRVATFHNQRDYIFFRHHKYDIKSQEKVRLKELGPRFTLKLRSLQKGTFDSKEGDYEWIITDKRHEMETSRKKFFL